MTDPAVVVGVGSAPGGVLKGRRLLVLVAVTWAVTVLCVALTRFLPIGVFAMGILILSPVLWLRPLWLLPRARWSASYAAPLLLFLVPVVLVTSANMAARPLRGALYNEALADSARRDGQEAHLPTYEYWYRTHMSGFDDGLRISVGGGVLAALLEVLALFCWMRRMPAQRWSIAVLLALFGPCVAGSIYFLMKTGIYQ